MKTLTEKLNESIWKSEEYIQGKRAKIKELKEKIAAIEAEIADLNDDIYWEELSIADDEAGLAEVAYLNGESNY